MEPATISADNPLPGKIQKGSGKYIAGLVLRADEPFFIGHLVGPLGPVGLPTVCT